MTISGESTDNLRPVPGLVRAVWRRLWPLDRGDWAVGAAAVLLAELEIAIRYGTLSHAGRVTALASLAMVGLVWWRRCPLPAMLSLATFALVSLAAGGAQLNVPVFAIFLVSYGLGAYAGRRQLLAGALIPPAVTTIINTVHPGPYPLLAAVAYFALFEVGAPVLVGRLVRSRVRLVGRLRDRTAKLGIEREQAAATARTAERLELTGELDALVVSGVENIVREATTADANSDGRATASRIEARGRELLDQMRRILLELGSARAPLQSEPDAGGLDSAEEAPASRQLRLPAAIANLPWAAALAGCFFLALEVELAVRGDLAAHGVADLLGGLALAAPLAWCRRRPLAAAAAALAAATLFSTLATPLQSLLIPIALFLVLPFCVAAYSETRWAVIGLGVCAIGLSAAFGVEDVVVNGGLVSVGFWIVGLYVRDRSRLVAAISEANRQLAEERDSRAQRAILAERAHVARELHDVVGHTLTVVVLQAGAARRLWDSDRERAVKALGTVAEIARGGLSDVLRSLRALEGDEDGHPGLSDVRALVHMARAGGLSVDLQMSGPQAPLRRELATAVYRIVQEALTNVLKHSPGSEARVRIRCSGETLELEIVNCVRSASPPPSSGGHGLRNMAARVSELGGRLDWGPGDGIFGVRAELPLGC